MSDRLVARSHRLLIRDAHAVDVQLDRERWSLTFVWAPGNPDLRRLRVALAQVAIAAFGFEELARVRMPLLEGERLVLLKAGSSLPGAVIGPTGDCLGPFVDEAPAVIFDASLTAFACERDGEPRVDVRLGNVRVAHASPSTHRCQG